MPPGFISLGSKKFMRYRCNGELTKRAELYPRALIILMEFWILPSVSQEFISIWRAFRGTPCSESHWNISLAPDLPSRGRFPPEQTMAETWCFRNRYSAWRQRRMDSSLRAQSSVKSLNKTIAQSALVGFISSNRRFTNLPYHSYIKKSQAAITRAMIIIFLRGFDTCSTLLGIDFFLWPCQSSLRCHLILTSLLLGINPPGGMFSFIATSKAARSAPV